MKIGKVTEMVEVVKCVQIELSEKDAKSLQVFLYGACFGDTPEHEEMGWCIHSHNLLFDALCAELGEVEES